MTILKFPNFQSIQIDALWIPFICKRLLEKSIRPNGIH
jgi:hypothetical protein